MLAVNVLQHTFLRKEHFQHRQVSTVCLKAPPRNAVIALMGASKSRQRVTCRREWKTRNQPEREWKKNNAVLSKRFSRFFPFPVTRIGRAEQEEVVTFMKNKRPTWVCTLIIKVGLADAQMACAIKLFLSNCTFSVSEIRVTHSRLLSKMN